MSLTPRSEPTRETLIPSFPETILEIPHAEKEKERMNNKCDYECIL